MRNNGGEQMEEEATEKYMSKAIQAKNRGRFFFLYNGKSSWNVSLFFLLSYILNFGDWFSL